MKIKTHKVLDLHYHEFECNCCFDGTHAECIDFASTQSPHFMYQVVPMTNREIETHPYNIKIKSNETRNNQPIR